MTEKWTSDNMPDQSGRVVIVTGANSGIGYWTALHLARKGAHVILACRSQQRGEQAQREILAQVPAAAVTLMILDLADLASIRSFAARFKQDYTRLNVLINNAGIMAIPRRETADGFEMQFGVNHLGHFALTGLLLAPLRQTPQSRVVTVSSMAHMSGKINFDDLMGERSYGKWSAYSQSKLANMLFAYELQRRFEREEADAISVAVHPGYAATNLQSVGPEMEGSVVQKLIMKLSNRFLAQSAEMGALPLLYAATAESVAGGTFISPDGLRGARGYPTVRKSAPQSYDEETAVKLWQLSEALTNVTYEWETHPQS